MTFQDMFILILSYSHCKLSIQPLDPDTMQLNNYCIVLKGREARFQRVASCALRKGLRPRRNYWCTYSKEVCRFSSGTNGSGSVVHTIPCHTIVPQVEIKIVENDENVIACSISDAFRWFAMSLDELGPMHWLAYSLLPVRYGAFYLRFRDKMRQVLPLDKYQNSWKWWKCFSMIHIWRF